MNPSEGTPEIPPILDPEHGRLLHPVKPIGTELDLGVILVDEQLFAEATMAEVHVYMHLVRLARAARTGPATMPPIREFSKIVGIDERRVRKGLHRLHDLGWIIVTNLRGPRSRFRIIVNETVIGLNKLNRPSEMIEREVRKRVAQIRESGNTALHNIYSEFPEKRDTYVVNRSQQASPEGSSPFPPHVCDLIASIPHVDKRGKRLASFPHSVIHAKAHQAPVSDIETGLVNLFSYEPSAKHDGKIGSIIATWSAMFTVDPEGKGMLKPRPAPKNTHAATPGVKIQAEQEFQRAVRALIDREPVYVGHLDLRTLQRARRAGALVRCTDDDKMEQVKDDCYAELDDAGLLQFHYYTREELERGAAALESLKENLTSPTQTKRRGPASQ